jgi:hypothetical protein
MAGATTPPPPVQGITTCQGSAVTTATPSLDPAAAILLQQYMASVTAHGWCRIAFEMRGGIQHFDFSFQPSPTSSPRVPQKCRVNARRHAQESLRRAAWVERRNRRSRPAGSPADEVAVTAAACTAAATTATTTSRPTVAAAATTAAAASYAAVAASAATAAPAAAAPKAAAATTTMAAVAAARDTHAAAKKKTAAAGAAGTGAETVTSPSPPAPPAKRKRRRPQPVEPTNGQSRAESERIGAIPQFDGDGDVSLGAETASLPATPPPPQPPSPTVTPPPATDPATVKNPCTLCNIAPIFNYERSVCKTCLESFVCKKCFTTANEYRLRNNFFRYMYDYCQAECKK